MKRPYNIPHKTSEDRALGINPSTEISVDIDQLELKDGDLVVVMMPEGANRQMAESIKDALKKTEDGFKTVDFQTVIVPHGMFIDALTEQEMNMLGWQKIPSGGQKQ